MSNSVANARSSLARTIKGSPCDASIGMLTSEPRCSTYRLVSTAVIGFESSTSSTICTNVRLELRLDDVRLVMDRLWESLHA